jgi:hypothetical protein
MQQLLEFQKSLIQPISVRLRKRSLQQIARGGAIENPRAWPGNGDKEAKP